VRSFPLPGFQDPCEDVLLHVSTAFCCITLFDLSILRFFSLQGLADVMPGREPCGVLLHHVRSSSSRLLQDFKRQAQAQVGLQ
jgi:hypothetical protein